LDEFSFQEDMPRQVKAYLEPLMNFAKEVLKEKKEKWKEYPIYIKATGGMRALPVPYRLRVMQAVRDMFSDPSFNPFYFEEEYARVISGEEEAIYGWAAVNFVKGTLTQNSKGSGSVLNPKLTYGVLEMGGASTQIGFFEPNGDVMANLFKLQIGAAKHWNVYCHSFLYFGINGAFSRMNARLYMESHNATDLNGYVYNPCLPGGTDFLVSSR
jgi:Golgi nucleoside diphosphatase